jgi:hypothetical protein
MMKRSVFNLLLVLVLIAASGCNKQPNSAIEVSCDATIMRERFATTYITVTAPRGHRIVVMHDDRRTEQIELNSRSPEANHGKAELFFVATLTSLPDEKGSWLHWTAHLRSGGSNLGGPTEAPLRVAASELDQVFAITVNEGNHASGESFASVRAGQNRYEFIILGKIVVTGCARIAPSHIAKIRSKNIDTSVSYLI